MREIEASRRRERLIWSAHSHKRSCGLKGNQHIEEWESNSLLQVREIQYEDVQGVHSKRDQHDDHTLTHNTQPPANTYTYFYIDHILIIFIIPSFLLPLH